MSVMLVGGGAPAVAALRWLHAAGAAVTVVCPFWDSLYVEAAILGVPWYEVKSDATLEVGMIVFAGDAE